MPADFSSPIRVLIVDDHHLTRYSVELLLQQQEQFQVVGLAVDGVEAIALAQQVQPDVVILDLQMPHMNGLTAATHLRQVNPHLQILAHSSVGDPQVEVMIQTAPIAAFCPKDAPSDQLVAMVNRLGLEAIRLRSPRSSAPVSHP